MLYNCSKSLIEVYSKLLQIAFYNLSGFEVDYIAIDILFYFINLVLSKGLMVNLHFADRDEYSHLVFMELIKLFIYYFCLLGSVRALYGLNIHF